MLKFMTRHQREEKARELALYGTQVRSYAGSDDVRVADVSLLGLSCVCVGQMWVLAREFDLDQRGATLAALDRAMGAVRLADEVRTGFVR